jgi:hypothetical protein
MVTDALPLTVPKVAVTALGNTPGEEPAVKNPPGVIDPAAG